MSGKVKKFSTTLGAMLHDSLSELDDIAPKPTARKQSQNALAASAGKRRQQIILSVAPDKCRLWQLHNRDQTLLNSENCQDLIDSIRLHGQQEPALVRELSDESAYDFEIVYGSRRRFACQALGRDLEVIVTTADDRDCAVLMDAENRARRDISDYERALDYTRWLKVGLYRHQKDLAVAIGIDAGNLNRLLKLAELPEVIVEAFYSPLDIKTHYGVELIKVWADEQQRPELLKKAKSLKDKKLRGSQVFRILSTKLQLEPSVKAKMTAVPSAIQFKRLEDSRYQIDMPTEFRNLSWSDLKSSWLLCLKQIMEEEKKL